MVNVKQLFDLTDKRVLVTGGASGIGYSMAEGLAEAGASVAICGRGKHGSLEKAEIELKKIGPEIISFKCDVSMEEEVIQMITDFKNKGFLLDGLVNNAGISWGHPSKTLPKQDFVKVIDINLKGAFLVTREVAREIMIPRNHGSIINVASVSGYLGGEVGIAGYSASKAGLMGLTRQLAIEWAPHNIRVNAIAPSWFPSYMSRYFTGESSPVRDILIEENPMGRFGEPWELKGVIVFLTSQASSYINGTVIPVDGGLLVK